MRKTLLTITTSVASLCLIGFCGTGFAQDSPILPELPGPGLKPGDFFYFLDGWGESVREFFTFNPERKAILQTEQALERIAEINALLEEKGVDAPGLDVAEAKIQLNMARADEILERQRARGIEIAQLAKRLETDFDIRRNLLESVFDLEETRLEARKEEIRLAIREARIINDFERLTELRVALKAFRTQKQRLDVRENDLTAILDIEEEKMELKMEIAEREMDILEDEMEDLFDEKRRAMEKRFRDKERALELQEESLEVQLRQAILAGDTALIEEIKAKLIDLELQEQVFEQEQEAVEIVLEQREGRKRGIVEMRERAFEQIKDAGQEILDVKQEVAEMIEDGIIIEAPIAVLELLFKAEEKLNIAEQAFDKGNYGRAFGQAMAAEKLAMNAEGILEQKEELLEKLEDIEGDLEEVNQAEKALKEIQTRLDQAPIEAKEELEKEIEKARQQYQERLKIIEQTRESIEQVKEKARERERKEETREKGERLQRGFCKTDADCLHLFCPMVIGGDTPRCNVAAGKCYCGPSDEYLKEEKIEMPGIDIPEPSELPRIFQP